MAAYEQYVDARFLRPEYVIPIFLVVFVAVLYVLGKAFTLGLTRFFEPAILRLPLVRSVYSSVKKVTDFAFVENTVQYRRVVAIEFPRRGIWTIGLVTGEGLRDIAGAANEPCVTVAVPGSPVPFTGNVVTVPKTEAYDLDMTIDEALQFFISCGVVVPTARAPGRRQRKSAGSQTNLPGGSVRCRPTVNAAVNHERAHEPDHRHSNRHPGQRLGSVASSLGGPR